MSAERGWIGDPQPCVEWRDSHYSSQADRLSIIHQEEIQQAKQRVADYEAAEAKRAELP